VTTSDWKQDDTRRIAELLRDIDICMLVTRADGTVRGRPMSNNGNVEFDGDSWFFTYRDTPKVEEIQADPSVELAYVGTERGAWISIEGMAEIVEDDDQKKRLWEKSLEQWFPEGPEDDKLVLLKVHADRVHAWADGEELVGEPGSSLRSIGDKEDAMERAGSSR
jgi:general stress protein 26